MRVVMLVLNDMTADARVDREATALGEAGHDVTVLALRSEGLPERERRRGYAVQRVADQTTAPARAILRKYLQKQARTRAFVRSAVSLAPDVVQSVDTDTLPAAFLAAELLKVPVVAEQGELYPDMLISNRPSVPQSVLRHWRSVERRYLPKAAAVLTVGDGLAQELRKRYAVEATVLRSVPVLEDGSSTRLLREALGLAPERLVVLYQGLVNRGRGLEPLITALVDTPGADLVIQGFGPTLEEILSLAENLGVASRVHYMGMMPSVELTAWASGADVGAVLIENLSLNNYLSAPNKLFQYLMAGIPLLGSDFPEISAVIREGECGRVVDPADVRAIAHALQQFIDLGPEGRAAMGARARELAETKYNWDLEKRKLLDVYESLADR